MISREFCCASSPATHVFRLLKASEWLTRPLKHFSQQYLINIDLLTHFLLIFFPLFSAPSSELGMNWEWMSTSNLTWPLLTGSLSLGIRATPSLAMGAVMCHRDIQLSTHLTTGQVLPTNKVHRKVRGESTKMIVTGNVYDRLLSFNRALSSICKIYPLSAGLVQSGKQTKKKVTVWFLPPSLLFLPVISCFHISLPFFTSLSFLYCRIFSLCKLSL